MHTPIQPLETSYRGYRFRSRLEARWAVCLDHLAVLWEYEQEGYPLSRTLAYLPDFYLPQVRIFAEVKPDPVEAIARLDHDAMRKASGLVLLVGKPLIFLDGPPRETAYWALWPDNMEPVGWDWVDVWPFRETGYVQSGGRFFSGDGLVFPDRPEEPATIHPAIKAARSAWFERP